MCRSWLLPILQIHDELCFNIKTRSTQKIKKIMESAIEFKVPSVVDYKLGRSWGEQSEVMIGWCAGLFDGEGNVNYAQYKVKNKKSKWNVALEI